MRNLAQSTFSHFFVSTAKTRETVWLGIRGSSKWLPLIIEGCSGSECAAGVSGGGARKCLRGWAFAKIFDWSALSLRCKALVKHAARGQPSSRNVTSSRLD